MIINSKIGYVGDTVLLQKMACRILYVGDEMIGRGYMPSGEPVLVVIDHLYGGAIADHDLRIYKLMPELDDDYYVVLPTPSSENLTISKKLHDRLQRESQFLSALIANGVDNWEGFSDACRESHDDEDDDE